MMPLSIWPILQSDMNTNVTILNFSGIYDHESFYLQDKSSRFVDMKDISGTNCYCDDEAKKEILSRISEDYGDDGMSFARGVHFIDNGNYHYISALYTGMIKEPFSLVVLDHHPDMQAPMFDILSCGGWVLDVIKNNPFVRDIHIIGADRGLIDELDEKDKKRAIFYDLEDVFYDNGTIRLPDTENPVYLSVDKDVLKRDEIITNWDQGDMTTERLMDFVRALFITEKKNFGRNIIGVDICGECTPDQEECNVDEAILGNDRFNLKMVQHIGDLVTELRCM